MRDAATATGVPGQLLLINGISESGRNLGTGRFQLSGPVAQRSHRRCLNECDSRSETLEGFCETYH
jgi:hypothetical protein